MFARAAALAMLPLTLVAGARAVGIEPTCHALLKGNAFTTSYELPNGYRLEALWELSFVAPPTAAGPAAAAAELQLRGLTESDSVSGMKTAIRVGEPWRLGAVGLGAADALDRAVSVWCQAVFQAAASGVQFGRFGFLRPGRLT